jgi:hypothetical protein
MVSARYFDSVFSFISVLPGEHSYSTEKRTTTVSVHIWPFVNQFILSPKDWLQVVPVRIYLSITPWNCMSEGFIKHLQIVTTSNYSAVANSHTLRPILLWVVCRFFVQNYIQLYILLKTLLLNGPTFSYIYKIIFEAVKCAFLGFPACLWYSSIFLYSNDEILLWSLHVKNYCQVPHNLG